MTKTEWMLFRALDELWPRCCVCGKRGEYRPFPVNHLGWWYCQEHLPKVVTVVTPTGSIPSYERAPGYEAMEEMELELAAQGGKGE